MTSALIVYGSSTGNTEHAASVIEKTLQQAGVQTTKTEASQVKPEGLCLPYDFIFFGSSTWGYDEVELQDDFIALFDAFEKIGAKGKSTAVFGCGDSDYPNFCGAVDLISKRLTELGAKVGEGLKIDGPPENEEEEIVRWTQKTAGLA